MYLINSAVAKSGTATRGRGHGDTCFGTWKAGTRRGYEIGDAGGHEIGDAAS